MRSRFRTTNSTVHPERQKSQPALPATVSGSVPNPRGLGIGGGHRVVISRLHGVARRFEAFEQAVDQRPCAAALVRLIITPTDRVSRRRWRRVRRGLKTSIAVTEGYALQRP